MNQILARVRQPLRHIRPYYPYRTIRATRLVKTPGTVTDNHGMSVLPSHAVTPAVRIDPALASPMDTRRRDTLIALLAVCLIALAGYAVTAAGRGFCSDDFALRKWFVEHGWLGAYGQYCRTLGINRPLGVLNILAWYGWLWSWPIAHQLLLAVLHATVCMLLFALVRRLTADLVAAVTAAAVFAAWHTATCVVVWTSAGGGMLPASAGLLLALILYLPHCTTQPTIRAPSASDGSNVNQSPALKNSNNKETRYRRLSVAVFLLSVLFYDQHLGAAALFSALALMAPFGNKQHPPLRSRFRRVAQTWPYWAVAICVGLISVVSSGGTSRPLKPGLGNLSDGVASVLRSFWAQSVVLPLEQLRLRSGPLASLSLWAEQDPARLVFAIAGVAAGCVLLWFILQSRTDRSSRTGGLRLLAVSGAILLATSLGIMAIKPIASIGPRHTFLPAMGVAMMIAAAYAALWRVPSAIIRRTLPIALIGLILGLSVFRLGHVYEWTIRSRISDRVLASLAAIHPNPVEDELLVIDGVRKYGRGFMNSWGLSSAFSLDRGVNVRIATVLRRQADRLVANEPWDVYSWSVDTASTRFYTWDEREQRLLPSSWERFLLAHPHLARDKQS